MSATQTRRCTNCGTLFEAYVGYGTTGKRTCSQACSNARRAIGMRKAGIKPGPRKPLVTTHAYKVASKRKKFQMEIGLR